MRTYEEAMRDYKLECEEIAEDCEKEFGYSYGSNYDLRVAGIQEDYPELFGDSDTEEDY